MSRPDRPWETEPLNARARTGLLVNSGSGTGLHAQALRSLPTMRRLRLRIRFGGFAGDPESGQSSGSDDD